MLLIYDLGGDLTLLIDDIVSGNEDCDFANALVSLVEAKSHDEFAKFLIQLAAQCVAMREAT